MGSFFHVVSPSPAAAAVACFQLVRPVVGRRAPPPRLQMLRAAETPRPRLAIRVQAQNNNNIGNGDADRPLRPPAASSLYQLKKKKRPPHNFPKENSHISSHGSELIRHFDGLLHKDAGENTRCFCIIVARNAVDLASHVVDSASLNPTAPGEISRDTVRRTLGAYVQTFVQTADDAFNNTVSKETITSFLGALRGLASVAHILLQAALDGLAHEHPKESMSEYAFNYDVKEMHHVYHRRMFELEDAIRNSPSEMHTCKILMRTILDGIDATESFVKLMMARRQRILEKTQSKV